MFHDFYSLCYWLANKVFNNRKIPVFSAVINISLFQILTLKFLFELIVYQLYHERNIILNSNVRDYIFITIIIFLNLIYYSKQSDEILKKFDKKNDNEKLIYKVVFIAYILILIILTIMMSISIRNNNYWF